ncbi:MAG: SDR family NAD(P)-dependent oxidoreductase [Verrucomicrobiales bacterium]|nr:SDR family NAD(P)-dependent oxidoreductase [Verrucomicrobiales bacterium]
MKKTILITGSTDGIGLETARRLAAEGHHLLLHGRNPAKLEETQETLSAISGSEEIETFRADFSRLAEVGELAEAITEKHERIDVLINNAGVLKTPNPIAENGLDMRFVVNTIAPWLLTRRLLPIIPDSGRIVNLSSAAQDRVDLAAMRGERKLDDMSAYSQSKLAITMWTRVLAKELGMNGPVVVAVNPGSLLASKMVKEGFGMAGKDLGIGADILRRAALSDEFMNASGQYFDNDAQRFADPHPDALDDERCAEVVREIESLVALL